MEVRPVEDVDATTEGLTMGPEPCRRSALPLIGVFSGKLKTLNGPLAGFSFTSAGHYEITLTVRDTAGNEASDSGRIVVAAAESEVSQTAAWVLPFMAIVLIAVLIAGLILGPRVLKRN